MVEIGWKFSPYNGRVNGLNDAAENTFANDAITGFVREVIQNSVDAAQDDSIVRVVFKLDVLKGSALEVLQLAEKYIEAGLSAAEHKANDRHSKNQELGLLDRNELAFFHRAKEALSQPEVSVLGIHDYGTTGLTGAIAHSEDLAQNSSWLALTRGDGISVKKSGNSGGSHGIGHNAPFAMSELNTVLYISTREEAGKPETLFQAAMRLRTIQPRFFDDGETSVDQYGYFGQCDANEPLPLVANQIPEWATALRPNPSDRGTSVIVVKPTEVSEDTLWPLIAGAAISSFYVAFEEGHLSVQVGERYVISKDTLREIWSELVEAGVYQNLLSKKRDSQSDLPRIEFVSTRHQPDQSGTLDLGDLGKATWSLRLGDDVSRKGVAFARGRGMYISHSLPDLRLNSIKRFPTFSLFVSLGETRASEVLKAMENPSHTEVGIGEVDISMKAEIEADYQKIVVAVIGLLDELLPNTENDEFDLNSFSRFFQLPFGSGNDEKEATSSRVIVGKLSRIKRQEGTPTEIPDGSDSGRTPREGETERNYRRREGDGFDTPDGEGGNKGRKSYGVEVRDLRLVPVPGEPNIKTVHFTPLDSERKHLALYRSGQSEVEPIQFRPQRASDWTKRLFIPSVKRASRVKLRLEFKDEDLKYPLEGRLEP